MDFRDFEVGGTVRRAAGQDALTFRPTNPNDGGKPFLNGGGEPLELSLVDPNGINARRDMVALHIRFPRVEPEGDDYTEAEADKGARNAVERARGEVAKLVTGWNLVFPPHHEKSGQPVPFTTENAVEFFDLFITLRDVTSDYINSLSREAGNAQGGSVGGPPKTDGSAAPKKAPRKAAAS